MEENETQGQTDFQRWCNAGSDYVKMPPAVRLSRYQNIQMLLLKKDLYERVLKNYNANTKEANRRCKRQFAKQLRRLKVAELAALLNTPSVQEDATMQKSVDTLYDLSAFFGRSRT